MKTSRFSRLGIWYLLALGTIAFLIIGGFLMVQQYLSSQLNDSERVNIAGRQRMLCQQIAKNAALLESPRDSAGYGQIRRELTVALEAFELSRQKLDSSGGTSERSAALGELYRENNRHYQALSAAGSDLLARLEEGPLSSPALLAPAISAINKHERPFLTGMDKIVRRYDLEARQKVKRLKISVLVFLGISLLLIFLETVLIFLPSVRKVNQTLGKSAAAEESARQMAKEIGALYTSLEKSYEKISHVNQPAENPRILAKTDRGGNITYLSDSFTRFSGRKKTAGNNPVASMLGIEENPGDFMDALIDRVSEGKTWRDEIRMKAPGGKDIWLNVSIVPIFNEGGGISEMLVLGSDLTRQRLAEADMQKKDRAAIERRINEQKFRSVLILEGQEEERKRIAMNIHDGIGQLITSLKYHVESLDPSKPTLTAEKQKDINKLLKAIIQEVRRVTFNLKPPVLSDYGLAAGLKNFIQEVNKLTGIELQFSNLTDFAQRMPSKVENNSFRIVQEAVNNAIKYSESGDIIVSLSHTGKELTISIEDHGKGFDEKILEAEKYRVESGHGFFNMFERTEYINGKLEVRSEIGKGTIVRLFVPLGNFDER